MPDFSCHMYAARSMHTADSHQEAIAAWDWP